MKLILQRTLSASNTVLTSRVFLLCSMLLACFTIQAQVTFLGDNQTAKFDAEISLLQTDGSKIYFIGLTAQPDPISEQRIYHLFVSDGTAQGTVNLTEQIDLGESNSSNLGVQMLTVAGNKVFFYIGGGFASGLYVSDGTVSGTTKLSDTLIGSAVLTAVGNKVFFSAEGQGTETGSELWVSDGTVAGTFMVKDILPEFVFGATSSDPQHFMVLNDKLYFEATTRDFGRELWVSDGTEQGTQLLVDLVPGSEGLDSPNSDSYAVLNNELYFTINHPDYGDELWKTDGTANGTVLVKDIRTGSDPSQPIQLTTFGSHVYFMANTGIDSNPGKNAATTGSFNLWRTDGTDPGTELVSITGSDALAPFPMQVIGGSIYFYNGRSIIGVPSEDRGIWTTDGTENGTIQLAAGLKLTPLAVVNNELVYQAVDPTVPSFGNEFRKADGAVFGTRITDNYSGEKSTIVGEEFAVVNNDIYFYGNDGNTGGTLWKTDGTAQGTVVVAQINQDGLVDEELGGIRSPEAIARYQGTTIFSVENGTGEIWKTDGTVAGTEKIGNTEDVNENRRGEAFYETDNGLILKIENREIGFVLDATLSSITELTSGIRSGGALLNGKYIFSGGVNGTPWVTDGSDAGSFELNAASIHPNVAGGKFLASDTHVYFEAGNAELWKTDGTVAGTQKVGALNTLVDYQILSGSNLIYFLPNDNNLYSESSGVLFSTTPASLAKGFIGNIRTHAFYNTAANETFVTDGTEQGTFKIADRTFEELLHVGNVVYLLTDEGDAGSRLPEIWRYDVTESEATPFLAGPFEDFELLNNELYVIKNGVANVDQGIATVFKVKENPTRLVQIFASDTINFMNDFYASADQLFFRGNSVSTGSEWFVFEAPASPTIKMAVQDTDDEGAITTIGIPDGYVPNTGNRSFWIGDTETVSLDVEVTSEEDFVISNIGAQTLNFTGAPSFVGDEAAAFEFIDFPSSVAAGDAESFKIKYTGSRNEGRHFVEVNIPTNDPNTPVFTFQVFVDNNAWPDPRWYQLNPIDELNFPSDQLDAGVGVVGEETTFSVFVANVGHYAMEIEDVIFTGDNAADFSVKQIINGDNILGGNYHTNTSSAFELIQEDPDYTAEVIVAFSPGGSGNRNAIMTLDTNSPRDDDPEERTKIELTGLGQCADAGSITPEGPVVICEGSGESATLTIPAIAGATYCWGQTGWATQDTVSANFDGEHRFFFDNNNIPVVAVRDLNSKANVYTIENGSLSQLGASNFATLSTAASLKTFDADVHPNTGHIYYAFSDNSESGKLTVMAYDGASWATVGGSGISDGAADQTSMAFGADGNLYVAFTDYGNFERATVMQYDGTNWNVIGQKGLTPSTASELDLEVFNNIPYLAFKDGSTIDGSATLYKFDAGAWQTVGNTGFTQDAASELDLEIDSQGTFYMASIDRVDSNTGTLQPSVYTFDGNNWQIVGDGGFDSVTASYIDLGINNGVPHLMVYRRNAGTSYYSLSDVGWRNEAAPITEGYVYSVFAEDNNGAFYNVTRSAVDRGAGFTGLTFQKLQGGNCLSTTNTLITSDAGFYSVEVTIPGQGCTVRSNNIVEVQVVECNPELLVQANANDISNGSTQIAERINTNFGTARVGGGVTKSFNIINTGLADLELTLPISVSGDADFTISEQPPSGTLAPEDTTSFTVQFAPSGGNTKNATVEIGNNVDGENPFNFNVSGTATPFTMVMSAEITTDANNNGIANPGDIITYTAVVEKDAGSGNLENTIFGYRPGSGGDNPGENNLTFVENSFTTDVASQFQDDPYALGTFPEGTTATITFRMEVQDNLEADQTEIAIQGIVLKSSKLYALSDDEDIQGEANPTVVPAGLPLPAMVSASIDSDTQITLTFDDNVQTNGTNPTDFTVTDAAGTTYEVSTQADGTAGDTDIVLTVEDVSEAFGVLTVTYTNNNNEISDAATGTLTTETDATGVTVERAFITTWTVTNDDLEIEIPAAGNGLDYDIDWGDGSSDENQTDVVSHTYASAGTYTVSITGNLPHFDFGFLPNDDKALLTSIEQWGSMAWESFENAFNGCSNMVLNAVDAPDLRNVTALNGTFNGTTSFNTSVDHWDVSTITSLRNTFTSSGYNQDLTNWDVSNVTDLTGTFAFSSFNADITTWDISSVTTMSGTFRANPAFNQDISGWTTTSLTTLSFAFNGADAFNQELGNWDVSNVTSFWTSFQAADAFNADLSNWNTSSATNMASMFGDSPFNQDISGWDVSNVTDFSNMFQGADNFNQDIGSWNMSSATDFSQMFASAGAFDQDLGSWDISQVTDMATMLQFAGLSIENYDATLTGWAAQTVQNGVPLGANGLFYCEAASDRQSLIDTYGWTIINDGEKCLPRMVSASLDSDTQITITFNDNVQTNEGNPTDFTVTDATGTTYDVSAQTDGTAGDTDIVLTVADMSQVTGLITVTYTNNNNEISDAATGTQFAETDAVGVSIERPFVMVWETEAPNVEITIPIFNGNTFDFTIDWGDGTIENNQTTEPSHTYADAGSYEVSISGTFPNLDFFGFFITDESIAVDLFPLLKEIKSWGSIEWERLTGALAGASSLSLTATDAPDLTEVTSLSNMFVFSGINQNINHWDVSKVEDFSSMFLNTAFNQPLNNWDLSSAANLEAMFESTADFNQNIGAWDVSSVTNMRKMFREAAAFNQDLDSWNTANVTNMSEMFREAAAFAGDISSWDLSVATDLSQMFRGAAAFNQNISGWTVSGVTNFSQMFTEASIFNQDISNWDVGSGTAFNNMFENATAFNQNIGGWDVSKATSITTMFSGASSFNQDISGWTFDTPLVSLSALFRDATAFDQDLSNWDISGVTSMSALFDKSGMSKANYDATLIGWAQQNVQSNVTLGAEGVNYCTSATDRQNLIDNNGWTITDAGEQCAPTMVSASLDSDTQITVTFNQNVQTNGGNPTDFTVTDAAGTTYEVNAQADGTIGDTDIVLTVADMSQVTGLITVTYTNNNNEISDADTGTEFTETDATGLTIERPFIMVWETSSPNTEITIPTNGNGYDYTIDWGDGTIENNQTGDATHTYATAGDYTVQVEGSFPGIVMGNLNSSISSLLKSVEQWGAIEWQSMEDAFRNVNDLSINATDAPDLSAVTSMRFMFAFVTNFNNDISYWDVSNVTNMFGLFNGATSFNQDISSWDVSNVTNMTVMFSGATNFNQPLDSWRVGNVTTMEGMFTNADAFNQDLNSWDVSKVEKFDHMFQNTDLFNGNITSWDVSAGTDFEEMFMGTKAFNQPIGSWNLASATKVRYMFQESEAFNQPLNDWRFPNLASTEAMFRKSLAFNQDLNDWVMTNITRIDDMFEEAEAFNGNISNWDVSNVTNFDYTFDEAENFNQDISSWDVSSGENFRNMFDEATSFNQDLSAWETGNGTNFFAMFNNASSFNQDISGWDVTSATNMSSMLNNSGLSRANYDALLNSWSNQNVNSNLELGAAGLFYCDSDSERQSLIDNNGWTITDAGELCLVEIVSATLDNTTQITVTYNQAVQTNGGNPTDFTVTDALGNTYAVTAQEDGTVGDTDIVLTVVDMTGITGQVTLAYTNNNNEISDSGTGTIFAESGNIIIERPFITVWEIGSGQQNRSRTYFSTSSDYTYDYTIDWGDGTIDSGLTGDAPHTYASTGTFTVQISGDFPKLEFGQSAVTSIEQWGDISWQTMENALTGAATFEINAIDAPDLSNATSMSAMFKRTNVGSPDISHWDVSTITDMSNLFEESDFNGKIDAWDVSQVANMSFMFSQAGSFNQDITGWNTGMVSDMSYMFFLASEFNRNIDTWDVSSVVNMASMFADATIFNQDLNSWDVGMVTNMEAMFDNAEVFNGNITSWDVSSVTDMSKMFDDAKAFNQDIDSWDVSNVTEMNAMFNDADSFNQDLNSWNTSNVTTFVAMFQNTEAFNGAIGNWDVSNATRMETMFEHANGFNQDIGDWQLSNVQNLTAMFRGADAFNQNINNWRFPNADRLNQMFQETESFNQDISDWETGSVTDMSSMFEDAIAFNQSVSDWDVNAVTSMSNIFEGAVAFNQNFDGWVFNDNLTSLSDFLKDATSFNQSLAGFDISNIDRMAGMLNNTAMSVANYDATLIAWAAQEVQDDVELGVEGLSYCAGEVARQSLIDEHNWAIANDDTTCEATISIENVESLEADGSVSFTLTLDNYVVGGLAVDVTTTDVTAESSSDYTALSNEVITFEGTVGETQIVVVQLTDDNVEESAETFTISLSNVVSNTNHTINIESTGTATINDDDDNTAPDQPTIDLDTSTDLGISDSDNLTSGGTITLVGTAEPNSVITVFLDGSGSLGDVDVDESGDWTWTETDNIISGTYNLVVVATDAAGNSSDPSELLSVVVDQDISIASFSPSDNEVDVLPNTGLSFTLDKDFVIKTGNISIVQLIDDRVVETFDVSSDQISISDRTITVSSVQEYLLPDTDYYIRINAGAFENEAGAPFDGISNTTDWSFTTIAASVVSSVEVPADGTYKIGDNLDFTVNMVLPVTVTDTPTFPITIGDQTVNATLVGTATNTTTLTFRYTVVEGDLDTDGISVGATMELNGATMQDEFNVDAVLTLNNVTSTTNVLVDGVIPDAPVVSSISDDTGSESDDQITNDQTLQFNGTAEANSTVEVFIDEVSLGTTTADGSGDWSYDNTGASMAEGTYEVTATATDAAGNISSASSALSVEVDLTAPAAPTLDLVASTDIGISNTDNLTSGGTLTIEGTAEAGSSVLLGVLGLGPAGDPVTADGAGNWSFTANEQILSGTYPFVAIATDAAGNESASSEELEVVIDQEISLSATSPADDEIDVLPNANLTMTFDKNVVKGTGNITIYQSSDDSVIETIDVTGGNVTIFGATVTIDPVDNILPPDKEFYVSIDPGAFKNEAGADYAGLTDKTTWSFTIIAASVVTEVAVPADEVHGIGDNLGFTVTMVLPVSISGTATIPITIGSSTVNATQVGTVSNSNTILFRYTILEGEVDTDGIAIGSAINLNGGTMRDDFGVDALLTLNGVASTGSVLVDGVKPTPTLSSSAVNLVNGAFSTTITYDEAVENVAASDLTVTNGTASNLASTVAGTVWTVDITPTADGAVEVSLAASTANDLAGNSSNDSNSISRTFDGTPPDITSVNRKDSNPLNTGDTDADFRIIFSEDVSGVDLIDLEVVLTGSATGMLNTITAVDAKTYDVNVNGIAGEGTIGLNVKDDDTIIDAATNPLAAAFTGQVYTTNFAPTGIGLSASSADENNTLTAVLATISTTDADAGDIHTYSLVFGTGDTDNGSFTVDGSSLRANNLSFNFEDKASYSLRLKTDDGKGASYEEAFTFTVNDVNEVPMMLSLSNNAIDESDDAQDVGTLASLDQDGGETFTYSLVAGTGDTDNAEFSISGSTLRTAGAVNFEEGPTRSILVKVTDSGGLSIDQQFTINIGEVVIEPLREYETNIPGGAVRNVFSPNGDGVNETWVIEDLLDNPVNEVKVYAQGGKLIFSQVNYQNDWGGTFKGNPIPDGTYYYEINVYNGERIIKGFLTIIRSR